MRKPFRNLKLKVVVSYDLCPSYNPDFGFPAELMPRISQDIERISSLPLVEGSTKPGIAYHFSRVPAYKGPVLFFDANLPLRHIKVLFHGQGESGKLRGYKVEDKIFEESGRVFKKTNIVRGLPRQVREWYAQPNVEGNVRVWGMKNDGVRYFTPRSLDELFPQQGQ